MGIVRKMALAVVAVMVLAVVMAAALVLLVNPNDYKQQIQQKAAEHGIGLVIAGDIGWTFFPRPGFSVTRLEAQVPAGKEPQSVQVGELVMALALDEIVAGRLEVSQLSVSDASTVLVNASGQQQRLRNINMVLTDVSVEGSFFPLEASLQFEQPGLQADVRLTAEASVHLKNRQFALQALQLTVDARGESLPGGKQSLVLSLPRARLDMAADTLAVSDLAVQVANLKLVTQVTGTQLKQAALIKLEPLTLTVDDTHVEGFLHYQTGKPSHTVLRLNGDTLDLDRYLAAPAAHPPTPADSPADPAATETAKTTDSATPNASAAPGAAATSRPGAAAGDKPLPLAAAVALPGDYQLTFDKLVVKHLQLAKVVLSVGIAGNRLVLRELRADAYQGVLQADGTLLVPPQDAPQLSLNTRIEHLQLSPLLGDVQQKPSKVSAGALSVESRLKSQPQTQAQLLASLSGQLQFAIDGLVIEELNIEQRVCEAAAKVEGKTLPAKTWPTRTEFRDTRATAQIHKGVMQLSPLTATLDTLDLTGTGPVNLVDNTLDLALDLMLLNNASAANFCEVMNPRLAEIRWPLRCEGNYTTQSGKELCGIDKDRLDDLLRQAAQKKLESKIDEKLKEKFGSESDKFKEGLRNLFH